jgi:phosphoglycolate phosphatase-like HAD superfamily hydrolase
VTPRSNTTASSPITTVIWDFDDTLADSFAARLAATHHTLTNAGVTDPTAETFMANLRGSPIDKAFADLEVQEGLQVDLTSNFRYSYWDKGSGLVRLYPGVEAVLQHLSSLQVKQGIVTLKRRNFDFHGKPAGASLELQELGIANLFGALVGFEDVSTPKPDPEGVLHALEWLGSSPDETVVVGDSLSDILSAKAAGCWSCYALWGVSPDERHIFDAAADIVAEWPSDLLQLPFTQARSVLD